MLASLDMAEQTSAGPGRRRGRGQPGPVLRRPAAAGRRGRAGKRAASAPRSRSPTTRPRSCRKARREASDAPAGDWDDEDENSEAEEAGEAPRPRDGKQNDRPQTDYKPYTVKFDEVDHGRGALRRRGADAPARLSRQAARASAGRRGAARQPPAAPADGAAEPLLAVRSGGGRARSRAPAAHHHRSVPAALLPAGIGHEFPRYGRDVADRQFRLDARPADHGRGDLRRHPGPDAGALRRQGRAARLHHAGLEGRAVARSLAAIGQAGQSRPPQRSAPHHLQGGGCALAAGAEESRADDARGPAQGEYRRRGAGLGA